MYSGTQQVAAAAELRKQVITGRTVNEELWLLKAKCEKAQRRYDAKPTCHNRKAVLEHHKTNLGLAIMAGLEGRTYRHR